MADSEAHMSRHEFSVAYDGIAHPDIHSMDVYELAPALLAFGRLIREANAEFNGKKAIAKVSVVSDFERKCFGVNFEVALGWIQQVQALIESDSVKTAQDVLEWLGLLGITGAGGTLTYLQYLKLKRGRKVAETKTISDTDRSGVVEVRFEGDGNTVNVHNHILNLSENPVALRATRDAFLPLGGKEGYDVLRLKQGDVTVDEIDSVAVDSIVASCTVGIEEAKEVKPEIEVTPAWLSVYSPVYDLTAEKWRFRMGREVIYVDISATKIAEDALARGGALADDAYQVRLEITTPVDKDGHKKEPQYKILTVVRFVPATPMRQDSLL